MKNYKHTNDMFPVYLDWHRYTTYVYVHMYHVHRRRMHRREMQYSIKSDGENCFFAYIQSVKPLYIIFTYLFYFIMKSYTKYNI